MIFLKNSQQSTRVLHVGDHFFGFSLLFYNNSLFLRYCHLKTLVPQVLSGFLQARLYCITSWYLKLLSSASVSVTVMVMPYECIWKFKIFLPHVFYINCILLSPSSPILGYCCSCSLTHVGFLQNKGMGKLKMSFNCCSSGGYDQNSLFPIVCHVQE